MFGEPKHLIDQGKPLRRSFKIYLLALLEEKDNYRSRFLFPKLYHVLKTSAMDIEGVEEGTSKISMELFVSKTYKSALLNNLFDLKNAHLKSGRQPI